MTTKADVSAVKSDISNLEKTFKAEMQSLEYRMVIKLGSISAASIAIAVAIAGAVGKG